jgi:DNA end-binding protein Ku
MESGRLGAKVNSQGNDLMHAIWKGSLNFSLVSIPITLYSAARREEVKFRLLRRSDLSPVRYKRVAEADGKEVPWEEIAKGYEYEKGKFVLVTDEDFERADVQATQSVEITRFVPLQEIDPIFFDTPYYLEPQKAGARAYVLLREALRRSGRVGLAKVVIKTRQHLAAVKPKDGALILELMHFAQELVDPRTLQIPGKMEIAAQELSLAQDLIERMEGHWKPEEYTDDFQHALMAMIQQKIKRGGEAPVHAAPAKKQSRKVIDLVSVLQRSLAQAEKGHARSSKTSRKAHKNYRKAA